MKREEDGILSVKPLTFPWEASDPFLFCVYHLDNYPAGNENFGPATSLSGRNIGNDFEGKDGWRMYHGDVVPGFPQHPHRGFETVTIIRRGFVDHSDSLGAAARFGPGDVQWLTAGRGIVHSEMFPLLRRDAPNPLELFQIWLNLPAVDKLVEPHFSMLWNNSIPHLKFYDESGNLTEIDIVAGSIGDAKAPAPPPKSWAARPDTHVAIWTVRLAPSATWKLPAASAGVDRTVYFFRGSWLETGEHTIREATTIKVRGDVTVTFHNGKDPSELLLLQGKPIAEPVAQYGPFVMNSRSEIQRAFRDYQRTAFGGWPWPTDGPVHPPNEGRYALHANGRIERAS
jgi:redox-sensitive bicupin YhaK (pirin superfamily)